jgi:hypothetical protein
MSPGPDFSGRVDEAWLAQYREEIIEPELPIVDPHHHLWSRAGNVYLFPELLADLSSGHNVRATVFEECGSMYRADGPEELRSLGETEVRHRRGRDECERRLRTGAGMCRNRRKRQFAAGITR